MDDKNSLISADTHRFSFNLRNVRKHSNLILSAVGFLIFLICLLFIFSILSEGGSSEDCGPGWFAYKQSYFKLLVQNYTDIEECRKDCMVEGGDLASIHDQGENTFIQTLQKDNLVWFGGRIAEKGGDFSWIDGSDRDFEYWDEREPDRKHFGKNPHECTF